VVAGDDPWPFIPAFPGASGNLPELEAAAKGIGAINWVPDRDQIVRRVPLLYRIGNEPVPALSAELLRVGQGAGTYILKAANASGETGFGRNTGLNHLKVGNIEIPTDPDGSIFIKFRRSNPAAFIPAWKVLSGELSQADVAGRIVLVGTSAPGLLDLRATPLSPAIPGVEIHAQVLEHILAGRSLVRPDYALAIEETCTGPSPRCNSSIRQRSLGCGLRSVHRSRFSPWRLAYVSRWGSSHRHRLSDFGPRLHCRCNNILCVPRR